MSASYVLTKDELIESRLQCSVNEGNLTKKSVRFNESGEDVETCSLGRSKMKGHSILKNSRSEDVQRGLFRN
jgi:hypothetical protein